MWCGGWRFGAAFGGVWLPPDTPLSPPHAPDIKRLRANYAFSVLLPIIFVSSISWVAFLIDPTGLSLRVSTVFTSLLSLLALQFVIEKQLPNSSYVLPTKVRCVAAFVGLGGELATLIVGTHHPILPPLAATRPALVRLPRIHRA